MQKLLPNEYYQSLVIKIRQHIGRLSMSLTFQTTVLELKCQLVQKVVSLSNALYLQLNQSTQPNTNIVGGTTEKDAYT